MFVFIGNYFINILISEFFVCLWLQVWSDVYDLYWWRFDDYDNGCGFNQVGLLVDKQVFFGVFF